MYGLKNPGESHLSTVDDNEFEPNRPTFESLFPINENDPADKEKINTVLLRLLADGTLYDKYLNAITARQRLAFKYTPEQISEGDVAAEDISMAIDEVRQEEARPYFSIAASHFEVARPEENSVIRKEQETIISNTLRENGVVIIKGYKRIGKTSMLNTICNNEYEGNGLRIDISTTIGEDPAKMGEYEVIDYLDTLGLDYEQTKRDFRTSGLSPLAYLSKYLSENQLNHVFIGLDETTRLAEEQNAAQLEELLHIANLPYLDVALVVHRYAPYEETFATAYGGFETHYIGAVSREEIAAMIQDRLQGTDIVFDDSAINAVYDYTGGSPREANILVRGMLKGTQYYKPKRRLIYSEEQVRQLTENENYGAWQSVFDLSISNYRDIYRDSMTDAERKIIDQLIACGSLTVSQVESENIEVLIKTGIVELDEEQGAIKIKGKLIQRVFSEM